MSFNRRSIFKSYRVEFVLPRDVLPEQIESAKQRAFQSSLYKAFVNGFALVTAIDWNVSNKDSTFQVNFVGNCLAMEIRENEQELAKDLAANVTLGLCPEISVGNASYPLSIDILNFELDQQIFDAWEFYGRRLLEKDSKISDLEEEVKYLRKQLDQLEVK